MRISPGSIVATRGRGLPGWLSRNLMEPETDRYHFLTVRDFVPEIGDYEFIESTAIGAFAKGVRHGYLLAEYAGEEVEIYQVNCPEELRRLAPLELIRWGKSRYDFSLVFRLVASVPVVCLRILWREGRLRRLRAEDLPYVSDDAFVCTEAVWVGYSAVGVNIIPPGVPPLPSEYRRAEHEGRMVRYFKGRLPREWKTT